MRHALPALRAERRAAIGHRPMAFGRHSQSAGTGCVRPQLTKPARASRETRLALMPSKPTQVGLEPRHSLPSGEHRRKRVPRLLGECPPQRHAACKLHGRPTYASDEGSS